MKDLEYLSDAELLALIAATEEGELLHAPRNVKASILAREKDRRKRDAKKQFHSYCARVAAATAASLAILFLPTPVKEPGTETLTLTQHLYRVTEAMESRFSAFNQSFDNFDFNFDIHFGGNRNE